MQGGKVAADVLASAVRAANVSVLVSAQFRGTTNRATRTAFVESLPHLIRAFPPSIEAHPACAPDPQKRGRVGRGQGTVEKHARCLRPAPRRFLW